MNAAANSKIGTGTGPTCPRPSQVNPAESLSTRTDCSRVQARAIPRAPIIIANVTMNGGMRTRAITRPLAKPSSAVQQTAAAMATMRPYALRFAAITPATATIDPTDRSIPPVRMTNVIPRATKPNMLF
jgi:uncharacterized protein (DUF1786 family)